MRSFAVWILHVATRIGPAFVLWLVPVHSASAYTEQILHSFCHAAGCADGRNPPGGLLRDSAGNLYGTAYKGGKYDNGVIFKLVPNSDGSKYTDHILHNFCAKANCADGALPNGDLIMDVEGSLYGTTQSGGASNSGVIYRLSPKATGWKYTIWHSFCQGNCPDGSMPLSGLAYRGQLAGALWDKKTPLFGTTDEGGLGSQYGNGVLYELGIDPLLIYIVVHKFNTSSDPQPVAVDGSGNLFGTTDFGGKFGGGLMYKFAPQGDGTWKETVLHNFCAETDCIDGDTPEGRLTLDSKGNIFGVTLYGGNCFSDVGCGIAFEKPAGASYRVIYNFCSIGSCSDGKNPLDGLALDASGNLFGTTGGGGPADEGIAFALTPSGTETVLYSFCPGGGSCPDGSEPYAVTLDAQGNLFGTTYFGGEHNDGTVFELKP